MTKSMRFQFLITRSAKLWSDSCARCHKVRDPKEFRTDSWRVIVTHMRARGNLTDQDTRDILKFLQGGQLTARCQR